MLQKYTAAHALCGHAWLRPNCYQRHVATKVPEGLLCGKQQVWLLGGPTSLAERLTAALPALTEADVVHVPEDDLVACYRTELRDKVGEPSSGWIGAV